MIDFHSHLDLYSDPAAVVAECITQNIYILSVTTTPSAWNGTLALAIQGSRIRTALGLHPQIAHLRRSELELFDAYLSDTQYVGEIGLDGAPEFRAHWKDQLTVFEHILLSCTQVSGRIMSIHSRRAVSVVLDKLEAYPNSGIPILHWFSGNKDELERAISLKCWFSIGPSMLRAKTSRNLVKYMPLDRVLTETDGPFAQNEGHPAMPWDAQSAADQLAILWNISPEEVNNILHNNLRNLAATIKP